MSLWLRLGVGCLLAGSLALLGCAALRPGLGEGGEPVEEVEVRPDAPAEYDVLVGQQHEAKGRVAEALAAYQRAVAKDDESAFLHRKLAELLARSNRLDDALEEAERAFEIDPDDVPTRNFLAQLHRLRRDPAGAERVLLDPSGAPRDRSAAFLLYHTYTESGRLENALRTAQWMVEQDPASLQARVALANAYRRLDRSLDAERVLREALELEPGNLHVYGALARSLREREDPEGEVALYREMLELHPHHHATLLALGQLQMAADDLEGAIATFEEIEENYPDDLRSVVRLGFLKYEAREYEQAAERFEHFLAVHPEEQEIAFFLGIARRRSGDTDAAIEAFGRILPEHEHFAEARTQIAAIHERRGDYAQALVEVERAAAVKPTRALDLYAATLRAKGGDFDGAVARLEELLAEHPGDDELLYNLGVVYGEAKRVDEAIQYMHLALEQNPDNASALNYIGYTWADRGIKLDEAEALIERALDLRPDDGYIADSLGWVYYMRARPLVKSGRVDEAQQYIDRALRELQRADELTGGDPVVSEHLGDTYLLLDQKRRALDMFEEALSLEPREGEQPHLFEKLETLRGELNPQ